MSLSWSFLFTKMQPEHEVDIVSLLMNAAAVFQETGGVIASMKLRTSRLYQTYQDPASIYIVAYDQLKQKAVGGIGLGPLKGLSAQEKIGEIRDLIVDPQYRRHGLGSQLMFRALKYATNFEYQTLYLETTPRMNEARRLFERMGFQPIRHTKDKTTKQTAMQEEEVPCYYLFDRVLKIAREDSVQTFDPVL